MMVLIEDPLLERPGIAAGSLAGGRHAGYKPAVEDKYLVLAVTGAVWD